MSKCEHEYESRVIKKLTMKEHYSNTEYVKKVLLYCKKCGGTKTIELESGK